ncbi:MAG: hypothetical protein AVDCRST_MAG50-379, partial [uncultured Acidimicrobiales bacterium]
AFTSGPVAGRRAPARRPQLLSHRHRAGRPQPLRGARLRAQPADGGPGGCGRAGLGALGVRAHRRLLGGPGRPRLGRLVRRGVRAPTRVAVHTCRRWGRDDRCGRRPGHAGCRGGAAAHVRRVRELGSGPAGGRAGRGQLAGGGRGTGRPARPGLRRAVAQGDPPSAGPGLDPGSRARRRVPQL